MSEQSINTNLSSKAPFIIGIAGGSGSGKTFFLKCFLEHFTNEEVSLVRRLKRDLVERGYSHDDAMYKWINHVVPAYKEFLLPYKDECDQVITNNTHVADDIICVTEAISKELRERVL